MSNLKLYLRQIDDAVESQAQRVALDKQRYDYQPPVAPEEYTSDEMLANDQ